MKVQRLRHSHAVLALVGAVLVTALTLDVRAAESFACGEGGKPNAASARCDCPAGKVEVTTGKTSRCVSQAAPKSPAGKPGALKCAAAEHESAGHCCASGEEWVPTVAKCVCVEQDVCGKPKTPTSGTTPTALPTAAPAAPASSPQTLACPDDMVRVPGGKFWVGSNEAKNALPSKQVTLAAYCIDKTEVTVAAYMACSKGAGCSEPATTVDWSGVSVEAKKFFSAFCNGRRDDRKAHPINCVDWKQAAAYCEAVGKRLPTEEEWEVAARGGEGRAYPWGDEAPANKACWKRLDPDARKGEGTCEVKGYAAGSTQTGLADMAGNVWEWTASTSPEGKYIDRGGGWSNDSAAELSVTWRSENPSSRRGSNIGFRCAR